MVSEINRRFENKPLAEYRLKVRRTKWFLNRFYTPVWLHRPTKTGLIVSLAFWGIGISIVLFSKTFYQTNGTGNFLIDLMAVTTTLTMVGMYFSFYKGNKRSKRANTTNT